LVGRRDGDVLGLTADGSVARPEDALVSVTCAAWGDGLVDFAGGLVAGVLNALVGRRNADSGRDAS